MRLTYAVLVAAGCAFAAGSAGAATADDVKWINQCVTDNKGGAADEVVLKYCTCMNNKMSDNETSRSPSGKRPTPPSARPATPKPAGSRPRPLTAGERSPG
jgi:hypothetical protein